MQQFLDLPFAALFIITMIVVTFVIYFIIGDTGTGPWNLRTKPTRNLFTHVSIVAIGLVCAFILAATTNFYYIQGSLEDDWFLWLQSLFETGMLSFLILILGISFGFLTYWKYKVR
jgi:hypothetical protein